ncbi:outer membrane protein assembly factor BamC [Candidatus Nitrotoga arctica]|uniref:Lipoprotein n=1 Tax=Candidatus Nitrotoga arctica TaxID=453162 RepID=A0ABM8Z1Z6_9PROT|nr:outer membrane protein assembly factor BamC [Candidatus Nitrotoga arctica]CAG9933849.1 Lipoprotein [Candidatus Nitrotoga arctica]
MRTLYLTVLFFSLLILAGCSAIGIENKRVDYKSAAIKIPALEVPPDLTTPAIRNQHTIPGSDGEIVTNFSDFAKGGQVAQVGVDTTVLPEVKNVHLERNGTQRWLVVGEKVEKVWPLVKEFWQEQGFIIKSDNPAAGLIETDWTERRAKIQQSGLGKILGKVFDKLHSSGVQDMYRTRLERSKDGSSSEIYISHSGMEEALDVDKNGYKWRPRPNDPELEANMLQLLMIKLGGSTEGQVQAGQIPKSQEAVMPKLQEINGNKIIILNEPFDKSWRKIGLALDQAGIEVQDKDRVSGIYFVSASKDIAKKSWVNNLMFWRNDSDRKSTKNSVEGTARYQVTVRENNAGCEVSVLNQGGGKDQATQRIMDLLYKQLTK